MLAYRAYPGRLGNHKGDSHFRYRFISPARVHRVSDEAPRSFTGRSAFLALLEDEGVTHLFGNPGTTELPIMDALVTHPDMRYVLGLQESIVVAMADGYSRASGQLSACNVHVAPGLGNALGSLYNGPDALEL